MTTSARADSEPHTPEALDAPPHESNQTTPPRSGCPSEGHESDLALRPGLTEVMWRQREVLKRLEAPFPDERSIVAWTDDVVHAAVGRLGEGIIRLLLDPRFVVFVHFYLKDTRPVGQIYRDQLHRALDAVFARALEDLSRLEVPVAPRAPVHSGGLPDAQASSDYR